MVTNIIRKVQYVQLRDLFIHIKLCISSDIFVPKLKFLFILYLNLPKLMLAFEKEQFMFINYIFLNKSLINTRLSFTDSTSFTKE